MYMYNVQCLRVWPRSNHSPFSSLDCNITCQNTVFMNARLPVADFAPDYLVVEQFIKSDLSGHTTVRRGRPSHIPFHFSRRLCDWTWV